MNGSLVFGRDAEYFQCLPRCGAWSVGRAEAHRDGTLLQPLFELLPDLFQFIIRSHFVDRGAAGEKVARIVHHFHANANMTNAGAVVHGRLALPLGVPRIDVRSARLQLKG